MLTIFLDDGEMETSSHEWYASALNAYITEHTGYVLDYRTLMTIYERIVGNECRSLTLQEMRLVLIHVQACYARLEDDLRSYEPIKKGDKNG